MNGSKKTYYSIGEVCSIVGLEPHVLRYWESEFSQLRPKKNRAGNRAYREKDIEIITYIKKLLYEEEFTISGAKKKLAQRRELPAGEAHAGAPAGPHETEVIVSVRNELNTLLADLKS